MFKILLFLLASPAFAQTAPVAGKATKAASATYKIKQVIKSEHTVVVQSSQTVEFAPGKVFLATFPDGEQCSLTLRDVSEKILTFDSSTCEDEKRLNLKVPVEPSLASAAQVNLPPTNTKSDTPAAAPVTKNENGDKPSFFDGHWGLVVGYSTAKNIKFNNGEYKTGGSTYDFDATIKGQTVPSIGITYARMHPNAWGFSGGLTYEFPRELKSFSVTTSGGTATGFTTGSPKLSIFLIEANMLYRWDKFYLPFGMNISIPYTSGGGADHDAFGPMAGAYGGAGYIFMEHMSVEVFARLVGVTIKDDNTPGAEVDYGSGYLAGVGANLKYWF